VPSHWPGCSKSRGSVRGKAGDVSILQIVETGSVTQPAFHSVGSGGFWPRCGEAAGSWSSSLIPIVNNSEACNIMTLNIVFLFKTCRKLVLCMSWSFQTLTSYCVMLGNDSRSLSDVSLKVFTLDRNMWQYNKCVPWWSYYLLILQLHG
jgi:hypothetical protein